MKRFGWIVVALLAAGCGSGGGGSDMGGDMGTNPVDRGRYIVNVTGACSFCHTPLNPDGTRDMTRFLAGWDCLVDIDPTNDQVGCINSRNLTNDPTGLMNDSADNIKRAFRDGINTEGQQLNWVMPYWILHNMSDDDADAVVAYLRTVPGVSHQTPKNQPPWDQPVAVPFITDAQIPTPPTTHPQYDSAMRGRYLASKVGLCIDCHTPDVPPPPMSQTVLDLTRPFAGKRQFTAGQLGFTSPPYPMIIESANLTPDATGLQGWTIDQIISAIKDGKDRQGFTVCAATHGQQTSPYAGLTTQDVTDIATYLTTLPPIVNMRTDCMGPPAP